MNGYIRVNEPRGKLSYYTNTYRLHKGTHTDSRRNKKMKKEKEKEAKEEHEL